MIGYAQVKDQLMASIDGLANTVHQETSPALLRTKAKIEEDAFNLVILGQFKRGKSTFINPLLGANLLPRRSCRSLRW